ncbi:hypothetical protein, partial [Cupriavidus sp. SK-3]|uniref:hypothetical protein n=1 Tax=Cupriavidus sp. SK-3 TaxID=1470558 RepID=UPI001F441166
TRVQLVVDGPTGVGEDQAKACHACEMSIAGIKEPGIFGVMEPGGVAWIGLERASRMAVFPSFFNG